MPDISHSCRVQGRADQQSEITLLQIMSDDHSSETLKEKRVRGKGVANPLVLLCIMLGVNVVALATYSALSNTSSARPKLLQQSAPQTSTTYKTNDIQSDLMLHLNYSLSHAISELQRLRAVIQVLRDEVQVLGYGSSGQPEEDAVHNTKDVWSQWATAKLPKELKEYTTERKLPLGWNPALASDSSTASVGHACAYSMEDLALYMNYDVGEVCPDDEHLEQRLLISGCEPLPRRRCLARKPLNFTEPVPWPKSLWTIPEDNNILWTAHNCKSFKCLNERWKMKVFADCLDCFDLNGREKHRWVGNSGPLDFLVSDVLGLKPKGTVKIGLDIGGGSGSFAARMREHNVTIVTSTLNLAGPFNNFIAHRGLIPLLLTISQRLPFFDNTLDLVHSMHVLSNWIPTETLEFLLYDIDRVLRPGGLFWLDHFFCQETQLDLYVAMIEGFGYVKHRWQIGPKLDRGPDIKESYISAVLEKPRTVKRKPAK